MRKLFIACILLFCLSTPVYAETIVPIRQYLNDQGYTDDRITYDMDRKMVLLDGRDFYGTWPRDDSKTYASDDDLTELIAAHKKGDFKVFVDAPPKKIL